MNSLNRILVFLVLVCLTAVVHTGAQEFGSPLTFQGLSHTTASSVASRGMGGITFGRSNDISLMFSNPASMATLTGIQISLGGLQQYTSAEQDQRYGGLQNHSAFTLLTLAQTGLINDPDTSATYNGTKVTLRTQADSVQRPFDAIGPDWGRTKSKSLPVDAFVAAPLTVEDIRFVGGLGVVQYANLNWYYQNNNCFSPSVLSVTDSTIAIAGLNANPFLTQWYRYDQQRDGIIYGYGASVAAVISERLLVGASFLVLSGTSDDVETRVGRGQMQFFTNSLRLTKQGMSSFTKTGTSDYSGQEFSVGAEYRGNYVNVGFSVQLPTTITRTFSTSVWSDSVTATQQYAGRVDSVHVTATSSYSGKDKISLPIRGNVGLTIRLRENLTVGLEYEVRSFSSAQYTDNSGAVSNPWLSASNLHVGFEYRAATWLALRGGVTDYTEVYQPQTEAIRGDPVHYPVYSLGCGIAIADGNLDLVYEYSQQRYVDTWSNAVNINQTFTNNFVASFSYTLPW